MPAAATATAITTTRYKTMHKDGCYFKLYSFQSTLGVIDKSFYPPSRTNKLRVIASRDIPAVRYEALREVCHIRHYMEKRLLQLRVPLPLPLPLSASPLDAEECNGLIGRASIENFTSSQISSHIEDSKVLGME